MNPIPEPLDTRLKYLYARHLTTIEELQEAENDGGEFATVDILAELQAS